MNEVSADFNGPVNDRGHLVCSTDDAVYLWQRVLVRDGTEHSCVGVVRGFSNHGRGQVIYVELDYDTWEDG